MDGNIAEVDFLESPYYSEGWKYGPPRGIMFHYSSAGELSRDQQLIIFGASVHFLIYPSGYAAQLVSMNNRSWHAFEASDFYFGIDHLVDNPVNPEFTDMQMKKSAEIAGEIIKFTKERWGMTIPIIRAPGPGFSPGFKEHKDGIESSWNKSIHTDGLIKSWTWQKYLDNVKMQIEEDDMALFESKEDFRKETLKAFVGSDSDGNPTLATNDILESLTFLLGLNLRMKGGDRPTITGSLQKGWDFAEKISTLDLSEREELPQGRLSGIITFQPK